ncbi:sensor histidine kinase [Psychroserpens sp. XS_ASV72]|uniref:sensor histidine kinase n=1 Tax=Psychroserpens sp. XS_ASV72 TaxID=3241293 RepID=UPI003516CD3A
MKFDIKKLSAWFFIYYVVTDVIGELFDAESISEAIEYHLQPWMIALTLSVSLIFFLYALSSYTIFFKWHSAHSFWQNIIIIICSAAVIVGLRFFIEEIFFRNVFGFGNYKKGVSLSYYFLDNFYYVFQYCALGIIFYFWQYSKFKDERSNQLMLKNQQMELDLLRSQTNPHFLFNTLNNIYALIHKDQDKAQYATEKLSDLLRYSLYSTKKEVALDDEISQIKNFIDLESLRHKEPPQINIKIEGTKPSIQVPQFILLPFIENAFKHGKLQSKTDPIQIHIKATETYLFYEVTNAIEQKEKDKVGGLGLDNLKKRLELLFPKQHHFSCTTNNNIFKAQLQIPI